MPTCTFETRIQHDGSVTVPAEAAKQLGLHPGDQVTVQIEAGNGSKSINLPPALRKAVAAMTSRSSDEIAAARARAIETHQPIRTVPKGKTLADVISGQWPGDESDEQIEVALREIS